MTLWVNMFKNEVYQNWIVVTTALDQTAQQALSKDNFAALPEDYRAPRVTMRVTFYYGEAPR